MKIKTVMLFLVSSQFHLDAAIIYNPYLRALRYDMYGNILTDERYNTRAIKTIQRGDIEAFESPYSRYLDFCSATWANREIWERWCRFDI